VPGGIAGRARAEFRIPDNFHGPRLQWIEGAEGRVKDPATSGAKTVRQDILGQRVV
jgi:hypothetical protein